jgi:hypothetical protein
MASLVTNPLASRRASHTAVYFYIGSGPFGQSTQGRWQFSSRSSRQIQYSKNEYNTGGHVKDCDFLLRIVKTEKNKITQNTDNYYYVKSVSVFIKNILSIRP